MARNSMHIKFVALLICAASIFGGNISLGAELGGLPPGFQSMKWFHKETPNFEINSIDKKVADEVADRVEKLKTWINHRWGLKDIPFKYKCLILSVPDQPTYKKWFGADFYIPNFSSNVVDLDNKPREVFTLRLVGNGDYLTNSLPDQVGRLCLLNYEKTYGVKFGEWAYVGMSALNTDVESIKKMFGVLDPNANYSCREVFDFNSPEAVTPELRAKCALVCLLLRKQTNGAENYKKFLEIYSSTSDSDQALNAFGFTSSVHFDQSYNRFAHDFLTALKSKKVSNLSLTWLLPEGK